MRQIQVFLRLLTVTIHAKPANMCKECRMNSRRYFLNIYNKTSKKEFQRTWQYKARWCDFVLQAAVLPEVISRTRVLMILRSVCTCDFNFSQQLNATSLTPKLSPLQYRRRDKSHLTRDEIAPSFHERSLNYKLNVTNIYETKTGIQTCLQYTQSEVNRQVSFSEP